jgi:hypothetical protein
MSGELNVICRRDVESYLKQLLRDWGKPWNVRLGYMYLTSPIREGHNKFLKKKKTKLTTT